MTKPQTRYFRFSIPIEDKVSEEWLKAQRNPSLSMRALIRYAVVAFGIQDCFDTDVVNVDLNAKPKVGRKPASYETLMLLARIDAGIARQRDVLMAEREQPIAYTATAPAETAVEKSEKPSTPEKTVAQEVNATPQGGSSLLDSLGDFVNFKK